MKWHGEYYTLADIVDTKDTVEIHVSMSYDFDLSTNGEVYISPEFDRFKLMTIEDIANTTLRKAKEKHILIVFFDDDGNDHIREFIPYADGKRWVVYKQYKGKYKVDNKGINTQLVFFLMPYCIFWKHEWEDGRRSISYVDPITRRWKHKW